MNLHSIKIIIISFFFLIGCSNTIDINNDDPFLGSGFNRLKIGDELKIGFYVDDRIDQGNYKINQGDELRIGVPGEKYLNRDSVLVMPDGQISVPQIGLITVTGKTISEISVLLNSKYANQVGLRKPNVSVELKKGQKRLQNFLEAIISQSEQGGLRYLISNQDQLELPYIAPIELLNKSFMDVRYLIRDSYKEEFGEKLIVTVNRNVQYKENLFYIFGEVKSAGAFSLNGRINIMNAVAISGGFTYRANQSVFDIKRQSLGDEKWLPVNSETIVMPGDIIRVNEDYFLNIFM